MPNINENVLNNLPKNGAFQAGDSDIDNGKAVEKGLNLTWAASPSGSYIYYSCAVGAMLDSGIVIHNRLPQVNNTADTLASCNIDDPNIDQILGPNSNVNLRCKDQYTDIVQRMGHSRYWFRIWGMALRLGYPVPIPGLKTIGGVLAIPYDKNPQWGYNAIAPGTNYGGIPVWRAVWSLWYTTLIPPTGTAAPAVDLAAHIVGSATLPASVQPPYSQGDDNARTIAPIGILQPKR